MSNLSINEVNFNIDINQNTGEITPEKADELGLARKQDLTAIETKIWVPIQETGLTTNDVGKVYFDGNDFDPDTIVIDSETGEVTSVVSAAPAEATGFVLTHDYGIIQELTIGRTVVELGHSVSDGTYFSPDADGATSRLLGKYKMGDQLFVSAFAAKVTCSAGTNIKVLGYKSA